MPPYAELSCQSAFSFLRGASDPETLAAQAADLGYHALALTDRDGLYGAPRFHVATRDTPLHAVHGTTLTLARADGTADGRPDTADDRVVLLAEDDAGWRSLCRLVSAARHRSRTAPVTPLERLRDACGPRDGLLVLAGPHLPDRTVESLLDAAGGERVFLTVHDRLLRRDRRGQEVQRRRADRLDLPLLVTGGARFARRTDKRLHDVLTCVRHRTTLDAAATRLLPNAEFCLRPIARIEHLFRHLPDAVTRTVEVADRCRWSLDDLAYRFPPYPVSDGETMFSTLHELVQAGARRRYRPMTPAVARQLAKELDLIEKLDLAGYFLVVQDIVAFCGREGILCQGRGSAANSAVCYALGITSVDPVGMELLFERFLSEERGEIPDIDLDIAHQDRERVLQYVYTRYGRDHAALAAEAITYRVRSAVRDAAKALGFTTAEVDALAKGVDRRFDNDDAVPEGWAAHADDRRIPLLLGLVRDMQGLPRHLSIHVGGMVITGAPLTDTMPVEPAAMEGRTVVPWDKDDLANLGIIKIDLLGLGMLTVIDRCLRSLREGVGAVSATAAASGTASGTASGAASGAASGTAAETATGPGAASDLGAARRGASYVSEPTTCLEGYELHSVPADDAATWDMLCEADTVGVFQVESRAQMNCLPRLRPRTFYDLVVEVALIRPGPIQGDMVHPYLRRRAGREPVEYPHPSLEPMLRRTLGIPLFQEQGMKIAVQAAGFTPGEADELRRAMGHKRSHARMAALSERLVAGMVRNGIDRASADRILHQLSAFADYGFPESHAASFARLVWVSAWLKRHHPAHFLCALLNAQPMGFYPPAVLVSDARRHGVVVAPVDVLQSGWESTLQWVETGDDGASRDAPASGRPTSRGGTASAARDDRARLPALGVRLGLGTVRGFGEAVEEGVRAALASQLAQGPFTDPEDFARRARLGRPQMEHLARLGALRGFALRRREALWRVARMARRVPGPLAEPLPPEAPVALPSLSEVEALHEDYRLGGATVGRHPVELLRAQLDAVGTRRAAELAGPGAPAATRVAGMVVCRQRPPTAGGLTFVTLEDETGFANLVVTPAVAEAHRDGLRACLVLAEGRVERADGVVNVRATRLLALDGRPNLDGLHSHDYH